MMFLPVFLATAFSPPDEFVCWGRYDLARLTCTASVSNNGQKNDAQNRFMQMYNAGDPDGAYHQLHSRLSVLNFYDVRSEFRGGMKSGGLGRLNAYDLVGLFGAESLEPDSTFISYSNKIAVPNLLKFDPWLKEGEEGYWWVRRGAAKLTEGEDEWAIVTHKWELAALVPFPSLVGPFGKPDPKRPHGRNTLPTEKESKEWAEGVVATLSEPDAAARRKKLLGYIRSENEILASWAVHVLTRMSSDNKTEKAIRGLLDDHERSLLVVITADRYLARHADRDWSRSAERTAVLVQSLQRMKSTERQVNELARYLSVDVSSEVVIAILTDALKVSDKEFAERLGVMQGLEVAVGLVLKAKPPADRSDAIDAQTVVAFYQRLTGDEYPKLVRNHARNLLKSPILAK